MSLTIHSKYKHFDSTVQKAEDRRQKFHFCRLPFAVNVMLNLSITFFTANRGEIKDSETLMLIDLNFVRKRLILHENLHQFSLLTTKCCCLLGNLRKHLIRNFFFYLINEIPTIVSNWESGAQLKLAHAYNIFPLFLFQPDRAEKRLRMRHLRPSRR